jgi:hypothetical protein
MEMMTKVQLEKLQLIAREAAAHRNASILIVANLRQACLKDDIEASDEELFVIAEEAIAAQRDEHGGQAEAQPSSFIPRTKTDRRIAERRQRVRRTGLRRQAGLGALVEDFKRIGRPSRRKTDRRMGKDRREVLRRSHVRRTKDR